MLSLPKDVLDELGLKSGESVNLEVDHEHHWVIITRAEKPLAISGIDEAFAHQVDEFIRQYRPALDELAK